MMKTFLQNSEIPKMGIPKTIALSESGIDPFRQLAALADNGLFIFRHYDAPQRAALAGEVLSMARRGARGGRRHIRILIAGDPQLAYRLAADGVHYPEHQISRLRRIARLKPDWQISAAAHSWAALRRAAQAGVDFALLSPVFASAGKPPPLGICRSARAAIMAQEIGLPIYALGGITDRQRANRLKASRIAGWAGVRAFAFSANSD